MVRQRADQLDAVFRALADPTRRQLLRQLADDERSIGCAGGTVPGAVRRGVQARQDARARRPDAADGAGPHACLPAPAGPLLWCRHGPLGAVLGA
jgi:hypothetical protein